MAAALVALMTRSTGYPFSISTRRINLFVLWTQTDEPVSILHRLPARVEDTLTAVMSLEETRSADFKCCPMAKKKRRDGRHSIKELDVVGR
jgi:hypothetical protein